MHVRNLVRRNEYRDSVMLMKASESVQAVPGVLHAALIMGTDANKNFLSGLGLLTEEGRQASAEDLIIAIQAVDERSAGSALNQAMECLGKQGRASGSATFRLLDSAIQAIPDANLAIVSVPGSFASREARRALQRGLNVFLFSDNVPTQEEIELKTMAKEKGLLVMGPECGTAIINHVGIGFANAVRPGKIGIVAASGTGLQEVSVLIHRQGLGISQAIGVGGRDLSDAVGGISTLQALDALNADIETKVIALVSKPPGPSTMARVLKKVSQCSKPVVVCFLGRNADHLRNSVNLAATLEEVADMAVAAVNGVPYESRTFSLPISEIEEIARREATKFAPEQRYVRGLFSGGTLCYEAVCVLKDYIGDVYSNVALHDQPVLADVNVSLANTVIDMGSMDFTQGRPHPMIDPALRQARILKEAQDIEVAALLMDVVLGYGSHPNPAGALAGPIAEAQAQVRARGGHLAVVASVCGTEQDLQNLELQMQQLRQAGVFVMPSNAQAARMAGVMARHIRSQ